VAGEKEDRELDNTSDNNQLSTAQNIQQQQQQQKRKATTTPPTTTRTDHYIFNYPINGQQEGERL
jgi:type II secretory pathway pseudopilin PulG